MAAPLLCRGVQLAADAGAQDEGRLPLEVLPQLPLRDLLNLYSFLATWVAHTFAAGPADLGPAFEVRCFVASRVLRMLLAYQGRTVPLLQGLQPLFCLAIPHLRWAHRLQEAIVLAAAGSNIMSAPGSLAGDRRAAQLSLTPLGLYQLVARRQRFDAHEEPEHVLLPRSTRRRLPLRPPEAAACADSLASCGGGLTSALEAAVGLLDEHDARDERGQVRHRGTWCRGRQCCRRPQLATLHE